MCGRKKVDAQWKLHSPVRNIRKGMRVFLQLQHRSERPARLSAQDRSTAGLGVGFTWRKQAVVFATKLELPHMLKQPQTLKR